jgi:phosphoribosyl 1,2-cyclic phosphate phosphodiesterase
MLDGVIVECTAGELDEPPTAHMGVEPVIRFKERLLEQRAVRPQAKFIATHFSHIGGMLHQELEEALVPAGIEVAYDGMVVEI